MIETFVGLARYNEFGEQTGGVPGDQLQVGKPDPNGELALIPLETFLEDSTGATIYRLKDIEQASRMGDGIVKAVNNPYIGYDVNNRLSILAYGVYTGYKNGRPAECDNTSLVRVVIKYATDTDLGDFTNDSVRYALTNKYLFLEPIDITDSTEIYIGDIIVLEGSNLTGIVGIGNHRPIVTGNINYDTDIINKPTLNGETVEGHKTSTDYHISEGGGGKIPTVDGEKLIF